MFGCFGRNAYFCNMNLKEEIGKWFLDVAKYVLTAMLLTSLISGLSEPWITLSTAGVLGLSFLIGFTLLRKGKQEEERKARNRERNKRK